MNRRALAPRPLLPVGLATLAALACSSTPEPTSPEGMPLVAPPPGGGAAAAETPATTSPASSSSSPAAASGAAAKPPPPAGGAPMAVIEGEAEVMTSVGYRGGKIRLTGSGAELSLPPGALADGLAFSFAAAPTKGPQAPAPARGALGPPLKLAIRRVEGGETIGSAVTGATTPITSEGPPFVLKLTLPPKAKSANLAVGTPGADPKKLAYKIYPAASVESGEPPRAVFQMPSLPGESVLQLTSAEPTEKP
ncbi:MAG TPA: hypothetical protein VFS43_28525 [Polyangiaceae bacterium]|nr:hypothetical protein [Polyangiaceae bacterium]